MSRKAITVLSGAGLVAVATCAVGTLLMTRAVPQPSRANAQVPAQQRVNRGGRNLFLQPEALRVSRRLGKRFDRSSHVTTVNVGNLALAGNQQPLTLIRRQTESGEDVEIVLGGRCLTWTDKDGTRAVSGVVTDTERLLVDRLLLDSPDQFVLAQLRGASYFTVARNVRPSEANDGYNGALWNLVRVDEPQIQENLRPLSTWRIYYINVQTGLPDRVEYQLDGREIRADFLAWYDYAQVRIWHEPYRNLHRRSGSPTS